MSLNSAPVQPRPLGHPRQTRPVGRRRDFKHWPSCRSPFPQSLYQRCATACFPRAGASGFVTAVVLLVLGAILGTGAPTVHNAAQAQESLETWELVETRRATFDGGALLDPRGVSSGPGATFYVADHGHHRVAVVDANGVVVRDFGRRGHGDGELSWPTDVAVDAARDRVYVSDRGNRRVAVFTLGGDWVGEWLRDGPSDALVPQAVAITGSGEVLVLSSSASSTARVERFSSAGTWLGGWGGIGDGPGQLSAPNDFSVHPDGRVLVADTGNRRLQVFAFDGMPLAEVPLLGVRDVAVDPRDGRIMAIYNAPSGDRDTVAILNADLSRAGEIQNSDLSAVARFKPAEHLAIGADGRIALTTGFGGEGDRHGLRQYHADWNLAAATVADPLSFAGFLDPVAIDVGPDGALVVLEGSLRVAKRYRPDGSFETRLASAVGDEIAFGSDGRLWVMEVSRDVQLRRLRRDVDAVDWTVRCDCFSGAGVAADKDTVFVTAAMSQTVVGYDHAGGPSEPAPSLSLTIEDPPYAWPLDIDMGPAGQIYAAGGESGDVFVLSTDGGPVGRWPTGGGGPERLSVSPEGDVFALGLDGRVTIWTGDGVARGSFEPATVAGYDTILPGDLAAGPAGRVYVLDEVSQAILVYEPTGIVEPPTPEPTPDPPCTVSGSKTASPASIVLGEAVTVELTMDIICRPDRELRSDIMLVIDRSNSMAGPKLGAALAAAEAFVSAPALELGRNRVGLVSFSDIISLDHPLTDDVETMRTAIRAIKHAGNTDLAAAQRRATLHLASHGRPEALPVILMLTDGRPNRDGQPYVEAVIEAGRSRARGALVYTIGLGDSVISELLVAMAGASSRYFEAPHPEQLEAIYDELSRSVGGVVVTDVVIDDVLGPDVTLVAGSVVPGADIVGDRLRWSLGAVPESGAILRLRVRPTRLGTVQTNASAEARYIADGTSFRFEFPIPEVEVAEAPTATVTPTPTATPLPSPTSSGPSQAFLPVVMRDACRPHETRLGADIVLVIDTSTSMAGAKFDAAREASDLFLQLIDPRRDRAGLIAFSSSAFRVASITSNVALVRNRLGLLTLGTGSRIDLGLEAALDEFQFRSREGSQQVIVLLSDGQPPASARASTLAAAALARQRNVTLFSIGLGEDASDEFLRLLATRPSLYYRAPSPADLNAIYRLVAASLPCR